jgi:hypothetical protein
MIGIWYIWSVLEMAAKFKNLMALKTKYEKIYKSSEDERPRDIANWISAKKGAEIIEALLADLGGLE